MTNRKRLLARMHILLLFLFFAFLATAQNKTITGKVTDAKDGSPIVGASVIPKGSTKGATTGVDGVFRLSVSASASTLIITSVGYGTQQVSITGNYISVSLTASNSALNEVVVIGYGTQQKKDLTGAISSLNAKDFQQGAITSPDQLIVGKIAGVDVTTNGGQPGNGSTIRIRGLASLFGNQDPLIVLDGVELPPQKWTPPGSSSPTSSVSGTANPLTLLNPDDIENITVLKDASAEAIYGSRAAAGVIIITTKKGRGGKPVFNFNTQMVVGTVAKYVPVLTASEFRTFAAQDVAANPGDTIYTDKMGNASTDWQKQIYQTALTTNNNLSVSGVAGKLPYRLSFGYHDEQGILKTDQLQRETIGIHLSPTLLNGHLKIELNLNGTLSNSRFANQGAIGDAVAFDPTQPVYQPGNPFGGYFQWTNPSTGQFIPLATQNPLAYLEQYSSIGKSQSSVGNIHFNYEIPGTAGLHAIADLAYDVANGFGHTTEPADAAQAINNSPGPGYNNQYKQTNTYVQVNYGLDYVHEFKDIKSRIDLMGTYSYTNNLFNIYNYPGFDAAGDTISGSAPVYPNDPQENTIISYLGRLIYSYDQRYILTASIRDDGSSRFSPQNRWGTFPSVALAWRISQEKFMEGADWLSDLKVRGGYGVTGDQDNISNYGYIPSYSLSTSNSQYEFGNTFYYLYTPAPYFPSLKWEHTASSNIGLDFGLFKQRISGSIDYYYKNITNLLNSVFIPVGSNFTNEGTINIGSMTDKGLEFTLNATPVRSNHFSWDLNYNISYNKNNITKLTNEDKNPDFVGDQVGGIGGGTGNTIQVMTVGYPAYSFFVLKQIYGQNGKPIEGLYVDQNRDGVITYPADAYRYKSPFAPVTMGFSSTFNYNKWSLSMVLRASIGNYVYNNVNAGMGATKYILHNGEGYLENATTDIYNTGFVNPQYFSDYYVQNASFLKLDNLGIGYNVGRLSSTVSLRLSANCQNVFVVTKYNGIDPEVYGGIDNNLYPRPRNYTIGASLNF